MFRVLASAVLALTAIAVGNDDGTSRENAKTVTLIDDAATSLTLNSYNADNAGTLEFHGDVKLVVKGTLGKPDKAIFGFCMLLADKSGWDCQRIETDLNEKNNKDPIIATSFVIQDQYIGSPLPTASGFKNDASF